MEKEAGKSEELFTLSPFPFLLFLLPTACEHPSTHLIIFFDIDGDFFWEVVKIQPALLVQ